MIKSGPAPDEALHAKYERAGAYTDCFTTEVAGRVTHAQFVEAFYTSRVFKLERLILNRLHELDALVARHRRSRIAQN